MKLSVGPAAVFAVVAACFGGCSGGDNVKLDKATNLFVDAATALESGDTAKAMELLTASIDQDPSTWACYERAKLHLDAGNDAEALADCERGLAVESTHKDLQWMAGELKKPADKRFKGQFAQPPSARK